MIQSYLMDTNVLSELMRPQPDSSVMEWLSHQPSQALYISIITQAEILAGIALLPSGKRRESFALAAIQLFDKDFAGRCLNFGKKAVADYAHIRAQRQRMGRPIDTADAQIASIAMANNLVLITRNTKDFEGIDGLELLNPWQL